MNTILVVFSHLLAINFILLFIFPHSCVSQDLKICKFNAIYQLGDSISDTGNSIIEIPQAYHARFPFGETIHNATGRPSDGLLIIDYIAQSAGLPLLEAYENPNAKFSQGVNFAVAGATALSVQALAKWQIPPPISKSSLDVQLEWLNKYLGTICKSTEDCREKLKSTLFMVGLIGPNDYTSAFFQGQSIDVVKNNMVLEVVQTIKNATKRAIDYGAVRVVVPGAFKLGCTPGLLASFSTNNSNAYDALGCLKDYNEFFIYHNDRLQAALEELRKEYLDVHIIYGDLYNAHQWILDNLSNLGFKSFDKACCGIGGEHNFSPEFTKMCGASGVPVCPNPQEHVSWDGGHFTQQANKYLAEWLIKDIIPKLQCSS